MSINFFIQLFVRYLSFLHDCASAKAISSDRNTNENKNVRTEPCLCPLPFERSPQADTFSQQTRELCIKKTLGYPVNRFPPAFYRAFDCRERYFLFENQTKTNELRIDNKIKNARKPRWPPNVYTYRLRCR